jgi:hypothetical protein
MMGLAPDTRIPGIIIFSSRATPLAGWMSGLELAFVRFESEPTQDCYWKQVLVIAGFWLTSKTPNLE